MKRRANAIIRTNTTIPFLLIALIILSFGYERSDMEKPEWGPSTPVNEVLWAIGEEKPLHAVEDVDPKKVERGKELVKKGTTEWPDGSKSGRISKFYTCNDCHNLVKEDPDLSISDPEARLDFAMNNDIPFLQGTTLYGVVNRETWYNGDYVEKYGELAVDARDTLENAIQLCATECAQGRPLNDREMEAMIHYFHEISITLRDIGIGIERIQELEKMATEDQRMSDAIKDLKERYLSGSPATFLEPLDLEAREMGEKGDADKGRFIYENSCQHCHLPGKGITRYTLDKSVLTFRELEGHFEDWKNRSIYQIIRYGTSPRLGYRPYMPHYTKERMSDRQIEHLAAYIRQKAQ